MTLVESLQACLNDHCSRCMFNQTDDCFGELIKTTIATIEHIDHEWVAIENALPDPSQNVYALSQSRGKIVCHYSSVSGRWFDHYECDYVNDVTAWKYA